LSLNSILLKKVVGFGNTAGVVVIHALSIDISLHWSLRLWLLCLQVATRSAKKILLHAP